MSRLSEPPDPVVEWGPEVLEAVRATPAPLYAVAYPADVGESWRISLLQDGGEACDAFDAADLGDADRGLRQRGYLSLAAAMCRDWERLTPSRTERGRGTPVFDDPGEYL
ncbi:hypothetical protein ACFYUH_16430 [Streptomyces fimicarius]|uniref:hypothetical protein n=1 Tax=Streptomyces griseus TaxID=1911 RepID=UPI00369EDEC2